jgi:hypothetical protein
MQPSPDLQTLCERGQELLMATDYLSAERVLAQAEQMAWDAKDWDAISRLYMPLQEVRRQKRQRCGEGVVCLNLFVDQAMHNDEFHCTYSSVNQVIEKFPHGQLLVAADSTLAPAIAVRSLAAKRNLYLETFLAAAYSIGKQRAIVIVGLEESRLPSADQITQIDQLIHQMPQHSLIFTEEELGDPARWTFGRVMEIWERLHLPWLAAADAEADLIRRMAAYRQAIRVDNACELAHQKLADTAMRMEHKSK